MYEVVVVVVEWDIVYCPDNVPSHVNPYLGMRMLSESTIF